MTSPAGEKADGPLQRQLRPSRCWNCFTSLAKSSCSKCKVARYCKSACQVADWKNAVSGHKGDCSEWAVCYSKDRDLLYQVTPTKCSDSRTLEHAVGLTSNLGMAEKDRVAHAASCREPFLRKNHILKMIEDDEDLKRATMSVSAHWIDYLLRDDLAKAGGGAMPDGLMALSVFLFRGNKQVWPFRAKNWLASEAPPFFLTLVTYGHCLAMIVRNNAAATHFWRLMNLIVLHPVCATVRRGRNLQAPPGDYGVRERARQRAGACVSNRCNHRGAERGRGQMRYQQAPRARAANPVDWWLLSPLLHYQGPGAAVHPCLQE